MNDDSDLVRRRFKRAIIVFALVELAFMLFVVIYKLRH